MSTRSPRSQRRAAQLRTRRLWIIIVLVLILAVIVWYIFFRTPPEATTWFLPIWQETTGLLIGSS